MLLSFCLIFCQFELGVAYESAAFKKKLVQEIAKDVENVVTGIEWLVLEKSILSNRKKNGTKTHEKKLQNLSKNFTLSYTSDEVITNLSNYQLSDTERD